MLPVITIARQFGSGGHEVGEKVAKKLGLPFFDKELIAMAAKKSGLSEEVFADADEKATSSLLYSMVMGSYAFGALRHHRPLRRLHPAGARELPERVCPRR